MPSVFVVSLGCPKNVADTEGMLGVLQAKGYRIVTGEQPPDVANLIENDSDVDWLHPLWIPADIALINTCAFIGSAVQEAYDEIEKLILLKKQGYFGKIVVAGCLVQREKAKLLKKYPEIDTIVSIGANIIEAIEQTGQFLAPLPRILAGQAYRYAATLSHTAYLKIADGCNNVCAFCTIPRLRGRYRSKPIDDIMKEAEGMVASGVREISLVAQDTTAYGVDLYSEYKLAELLKALTKIDGLNWIRIMYAYPERVTPELLQVMAEEPKVCHYLDMPIQHIADSVLKRMRRVGSTGTLLKAKVKLIRKFLPDIALRTTLMVGYPGETEADFKRLKDFVKEYEFSKLSVFAYCRENGTKAAALTGQLPQAVKDRRSAELTEVQSRVIDRKNKKMIGKRLKILMDMPLFGRSQYEAPDIDGGVQVTSRLSPGQFADVEIIGAQGYILKAKMQT